MAILRGPDKGENGVNVAEEFAQSWMMHQLTTLQTVVRSFNERVLGQRSVPTSKRVPWWSRELTARRKAVVKLKRDCRKARSRDDVSLPWRKDVLHAALDAYKRSIRLAKEDR